MSGLLPDDFAGRAGKDLRFELAAQVSGTNLKLSWILPDAPP